jgi:hypothetical protein
LFEEAALCSLAYGAVKAGGKGVGHRILLREECVSITQGKIRH